MKNRRKAHVLKAKYYGIEITYYSINITNKRVGM